MASVKRLLERVLIEGGGELSSTMLSMGGRPSLYGTISEQVLDESSPLLVDLGLANRDAKHFFVGVGRFTTFIFFSQSGGNLPAYKYHPLSFSCHSNMADLLYFLAYAITNLVGNNNRGFTEIMACRPSGGIRENHSMRNRQN